MDPNIAYKVTDHQQPNKTHHMWDLPVRQSLLATDRLGVAYP